MDDEDRAALAALGIRPGVTYSVVSVYCTQSDCIYISECMDNAIGMADDDSGMFMVCHDYKTSLLSPHKRKQVFWKRQSGASNNG